ncbi:hypothetical protein AMK14_31210 [Streptomyces sp. TSRI0445]|uniref:hypothetical protein n=1 Tax=Streptomyces TaxID=1883 RepID=UPI0005C86478|nr:MULTISPECIES: hypothetical protein [Streptomyces]PPA41415.1 hypothetical protein BF14_017920 [Streptomyces griseus]RAN18741.1 hypothetical protein A3838_17480 [Streptomyces badius]AWL87561.1 hypothetical protein DIJ69_17910 [Streptomyces globisporus]OKI63137.1 hypothetical protein AMK14_31210 [Streptomyces sp. TSRI0445]RAN26640.1 hypothetical protein A3800_17490 [Streptomyces badius]
MHEDSPAAARTTAAPRTPVRIPPALTESLTEPLSASLPEAPPPGPPAGHSATTIERGSFCLARCSCGWSGPARRSRDRARTDAAEHLTAP